MPDSSEAKVGDRVYSIKYGWGSIEKIRQSINKISVVFDNGNADDYFFNGHFVYSPNREFRDLYLDVPEISDPPKPKRMITAIRWVNVYKSSLYGPESTGRLYFSYKEAMQEISILRKEDYITTIPIEFEVEE